jgi:two-component system, sensor histidine kinase ChiS
MKGPVVKKSKGAKRTCNKEFNAVKSPKRRGKLSVKSGAVERKLSELDRMKQDFISSVTHELRSPLTAIKGYVNLLLEGRTGALSGKQISYLTIVKNNTSRLNRFINDIMDLAKLEEGMMDMKAEPVRLCNVAKEIAALMSSVAEERKIRVLLDVPENLPEIMADSDRVGQIITNLLGNALKFTPEGGTVTIKGEDKGGCLQISVADTGIGMPKEALGKIFGKFEQVPENRGRTRGAKGTGLGLAVARGLVLAHGGKIWVESEVDRGTTFYFTLIKK